MSEIKWIKLTTSIFDDEKIKLIDGLPERDAIFVIWIKLLTLAGKVNDNGSIYLSENVPYTDDMLATIFNRPVSIVRLALKTFHDFRMIDISENQQIEIINWEKHQNVDGMDKIREQNRIRKQRQRAKKQICHDMSRDTSRDVTQQNKNKNKKKIKSKEKENIKEKEKSCPENPDHVSEKISEIISYLNDKADTKYRSSSQKTKSLIRARLNEKFSVDDFKKVIDNKVSEWKGDMKMEKYLRPETLFGTKFESYLNQNLQENFDQNEFLRKMREGL